MKIDPHKHENLSCSLNSVSLKLPSHSPLVIFAIEGIAMGALERASHYGNTPWIRKKIEEGQLRLLQSVTPSTSEANFSSLLTMQQPIHHRAITSRSYDVQLKEYRTRRYQLGDNILAQVQQSGGDILALSAEDAFDGLYRESLRFYESDSHLLNPQKREREKKEKEGLSSVKKKIGLKKKLKRKKIRDPITRDLTMSESVSKTDTLQGSFESAGVGAGEGIDAGIGAGIDTNNQTQVNVPSQVRSPSQDSSDGEFRKDRESKKVKPKKKKKRILKGEQLGDQDESNSSQSPESKSAYDELKLLSVRPKMMGQAVAVSMESLRDARVGSHGIDGRQLYRALARKDAAVNNESILNHGVGTNTSGREDITTLDTSQASTIDVDFSTDTIGALVKTFAMLFQALEPSLSVVKLPRDLALKMPASSAEVASYLKRLDVLFQHLDNLGVHVWLVSVSAFENCRVDDTQLPNIARLDSLFAGFEVGVRSPSLAFNKRDERRIDVKAMSCGGIQPYKEASAVAGVFLPDKLKNDARFLRDLVEYLVWEPCIDQVLSQARLQKNYATYAQDLGDIILFASSGWIFVNGQKEQRLAQKSMPLRSTGGFNTSDLAFLTCGKMSDFGTDKGLSIAINDVWLLLRDVHA